MAAKPSGKRKTTVSFSRREASLLSRIEIAWVHSDAKPGRKKVSQNDLVSAALLLLERVAPQLDLDGFNNWEQVRRFLKGVRFTVSGRAASGTDDR